MHAGWYAFDPAALPRGVVAADSSQTAAALWPGPILSVLEELADRLPPAAYPDVVFLGGRTPHPLAAVLRGLGSPHPAAAGPGPAVDVAANLGRYPVAGPLLRDLLDGDPRPVLLLLNGLPLDLDDWAVPEVTARTLVYRLTGADRVSPPGFRELGPAADLGGLVAHLADPVTAVRLDGLALDWDADAYRWADGTLTADGPTAPAVRVRLVIPGGTTPGAVVTRAGGAEHRLPLRPILDPPTPPAAPLSPAEGLVLDLWERGQGYYCPACHHAHPSGRVRCEPPAAGAGLFPTVVALPPAPLWVVRNDGGRWMVTPVPRGILPLPDGRVLVRRPGAAACYAPEDHGWVPTTDPGPFVPLGDGAYAVGG